MSQSTTSTTFSDSPPSSPNTYADSSPPSSPCSEQLNLPDHLSDPYAGTQKLTRKLREYDWETRPSRKARFSADWKRKEGPRKKAKYEHDLSTSQLAKDEMEIDDDDEQERRNPDEDQRSELIWEDAIDNAIENSCGQVDLSNQGLTKISEVHMQNLAKLVVLPEHTEREHAPALSVQRSFSRTSSQALGVRRDMINLYLSRNRITHLPKELFIVNKLTVLALRGNKIHRIPPEISNLLCLEELNIASNQIEYLPSEMNIMRLRVFTVTGNPFLQSPSDDAKSIVYPMLPGRIPPLSELCLRVLLESPPPLNDNDAYVPPTMREAYHNCRNRSPSFPALGDGYKSVTCMGTCVGCREPFVMHAEETFTWEPIVAGCVMSPPVPLRWRGCMVGCLDRHFTAHDETLQDAKEDMFVHPVLLGGLDEDFEFGG